MNPEIAYTVRKYKTLLTAVAHIFMFGINKSERVD